MTHFVPKVPVLWGHLAPDGRGPTARELVPPPHPAGAPQVLTPGDNDTVTTPYSLRRFLRGSPG